MAATKTASKTGTAGRIEKLRALAEHPNTPAHEAEVARHALGRLLAKVAEAGGVAAYTWTPNWQGEKYQDTRGLTLTQVMGMASDQFLSNG